MCGIVRCHRCLLSLYIHLQEHIIDLALREGRRFLYEGQPSLALPAATEALRFMTEVYGEADIELTPAYLILAEATIGN